MEEKLSKKAASGMIWKLLEKISAQGMSLIIQIVLARLLLPEEYGLVGLLSIFITISDVFILQGLTTALIQKKDADDIDFSSVFFANIAVSLVLYGILFLTAPLVASFYKESRLTDIMRVLSLNVVIGAIPAVHNAILSRQLDFRKSFYRNISNVLTQGAVGITLALLGFGAWAMVFSRLAGMLVGTVVLCATVKWKPIRVFDTHRVKQLFSYSSKVLATNLLNTVFNNIHSLIIGRAYSAADVGHYQRGQQIPQSMMSAVDGSLTEVLYPTFSKCQSDLTLLKSAVRKSVSTSMFVVLPLLMGLLAVAEPLTLMLLTEKWLPSVPFMQLSCIVCMFWPLSHRSHALNALGKSNITLKLSLISKATTLVMIFVCLRAGIYAIMLGSIFASFIGVCISSYYVKKYIGYTVKELLCDVLPSLLLSLVMCGCVLAVGLLKLPTIVILALQVIAGVAVYVGLSAVFRLKAFAWMLNMLKNIIHKKIK